MRPLLPLLLSLPFALSSGVDYSTLPTSHLHSLASSLLTTSPAQALEAYDALYLRDPGSWEVVYKRATVRLALGQLRRAEEGFEESLGRRESEMARLQLARIHLKLGSFSRALSAAKHPTLASSSEIPNLLTVIESTSSLSSSAAKALQSGHYPDCVRLATEALENAPNSLELRLRRSDCYLLSEDARVEEAVGDLTRASTLASSQGAGLDPDLLIRQSLLSLLYIPPPSSTLLAPIKACLHSDPEQKSCLKAHRLLKKVDKEWARVQNLLDSGEWKRVGEVVIGENAYRGKSTEEGGVLGMVRGIIAAYDTAESTVLPARYIASHPPTFLTQLLSHACRSLLSASSAASPTAVYLRRAIPYCSQVHAQDPEDPWGMVGKGEEAIFEERWEEAVRFMEAAFEKEQRDRGMQERLQRARKLLKVSKQKDYYKILGVSRDADAKTIKKAYRKATLKAHPDKGGSEEKMAEVNGAYEVLSDPELRARFDSGEDPLDPASQQGGPFFQGPGSGMPHHVFQQFFQGGSGMPFGGGGGGQQFSFRFG